MTSIRTKCTALTVILALSIAPSAFASGPRAATLGDVEVVETKYREWRSVRTRSEELTVSVGWSKGLSAQTTSARGRVGLDLGTGVVSADFVDLPTGSTWDLWLVDNSDLPGLSAIAEPGDRRIRVGTLEQNGGAGSLRTRLDPNPFPQFSPDLLVIAASDASGPEAGLLFGAPTLFQRIEHGLSGANANFQDLVSQGETLFFEETFDGNSRTCASCHPAVNNFTIDPDFIATLPADDPLFVAEFIPELAENFEKPEMMRSLGLILENVDGLDDLANKFVLRGVPHMLAMSSSIAPAFFDSSGGGLVPPFERTGWSGDGAPGGGTLREFPLGAIAQHLPLTLGRTPGVDFRLPTDDELDAIEAFTLSLGRPADLDLDTLRLANPVDIAGKALFLGDAQCFECHLNAGANAGFLDPAGTQNTNFDTGVEDVVPPARRGMFPRDGGFGQDPHPLGGFGDGRFNTVALVEAADTGPFFHNNVFADIEDAVDFYNSDEFNESPGGIFLDGISMLDEEVIQIAVFLRVLNALENIRSARDLCERALGAAVPGRVLTVAAAETEDAIQVLVAKELHTVAVIALERALARIEEADATADPAERDVLVTTALGRLEAAR